MRRPLTRLAACLSVAALFAASAVYGATVTGTVFCNAQFAESISAGAIEPYSIPAAINQTLNYSAGTNPNQVDTLYAKQLTLAGAAQTLDLTSLTDPSGAAINFARVRELIIQNTATGAGNDVKVEQGSANGWAVLPPQTAPAYCRYGGTLRISDPLSTGAGNGNVVTSTSRTVTLDPGANTINVNVLIVGGSAA